MKHIIGLEPYLAKAKVQPHAIAGFALPERFTVWKRVLWTICRNRDSALRLMLSHKGGNIRMVFKSRLRALSLVFIGLAIFAPVVASADPSEVRLASGDARELWKKGSDQVLAGDFASAIGTLEQVQKLEPGHAEVNTAIEWMRDA